VRPASGIETSWSHPSRTSRDIPSPSEPTTRTTGRVGGATSWIVRSARWSSPTTPKAVIPTAQLYSKSGLFATTNKIRTAQEQVVRLAGVNLPSLEWSNTGERISNLNGDRQGAAEIERSSIHQLAHVLALDILHGDEVDAFNVVEIEDGTDVRMVE
jgi:hypothetical protein